MRREELAGRELATIYLGGGTPSQLSGENLERLFACISRQCEGSMAQEMEVTIECNPDDVTPLFVEALGRLPVNRVSMGAQTFSDQRLQFLHRRHRAADVGKAVSLLKEVGIGNISVDLMFGFPEETMEDWERDMEAALALDVAHLSAYSLMYEEGTALTKMAERGEVKPLDEELCLRMYERLMERLAAAGYRHYEISNWAKPGKESRHNSSYWRSTPYIGIGAAAHSYDILTRSWNVASVNRYMEAIEQGNRPAEWEEIDERTCYNDLITTALRTCEGISLSVVPTEQRTYLLRMAEPAVRGGLLKMEDGRVHLTRKGLFVSDSVFSDLMMIE